VWSGLEVIVACLVSLAIGAGTTWLYVDRFSTRGRGTRAAEREAQRAKDELRRYKQDVHDHFQRTAQLVDGLTEAYRDVHNHLAEGAMALVETPRGGEPVLATIPNRISGKSTSPRPLPADLAPPLDYAPKRSPHDKGMLDESFGLERLRTTEEETPRPPLV